MKIGKVYKIIHTQSDICYVGSTTASLKSRWWSHKSKYNHSKKTNGRKCAIYEYFEKYGISQFKIILIKEYEVVDKKHILAYEQLWINRLKCVNKCDTLGGFKKHKDKIYAQKNKEKIKERYLKWAEGKEEYLRAQKRDYYKNNKEAINEKAKKYRDNNKEHLRAQKRDYYKNNKEAINEKDKEKYKNNKEAILAKNKEYRERNKDKINARNREKVNCPICDKQLNRTSLSRHKKIHK